MPTNLAVITAQNPQLSVANSSPDLDNNVANACARIAPTWPLDRFIAVNPFWGMINEPLPRVAATLQALSGAKLLMPRAWYRQAYREGRLLDRHLDAAIQRSGSTTSLGALRALIDEDEATLTTRARVLDVADVGRDLVHEVSWRHFVTHNISQFCAAHFDEGQAQVGPNKEGGLYASWRRQALTDRSPALLMRVPTYRTCAKDLPGTARELVETAIAELKVQPRDREGYFHSLLLAQNGWASWCAYRRFAARLIASDDDAIVDLLAIRLAWEWLVYRTGGAAVRQGFAKEMARWPQIDQAAAEARPNDWLLQTAMEIAWRESVLRELPSGLRAARPRSPAVQAVFCIDVRSEVFRRALESTSPAVQTLGFAGFFGLPIDYQPLAAKAARPQLPGLLAPRLRVADTGLGEEATEERTRNLDLTAAFRAFKRDALSTFTFVEALGIGYAGALVMDSLGLNRAPSADSAGLSAARDRARQPRLVGTVDGEPLALSARCELAAQMLRSMSLTREFARLVLLAGHGSQTRNNPFAAGLDCGACCGQTGEVNARSAAALLNEPGVRSGLAERGIHVPSSTWFVAGLHNTTTDEVALFDLDGLPPSHQEDLGKLRSWLADAGHKTRTERASLLAIHDTSNLHRAVSARAADWAQVRAEWGLANNAAFIVAPREHSQHLNLRGRSFLHEYRYEEDEGFGVLEQIMTAPMVVAHWINLQYYASTVDNERYGSGNKVLHNVVGGHLGVFEGNGGDLRIGLPMQSLHDGERWVHTPLRLSVFIEAPRPAIDAVLKKHATVRALIDNQWLSIFQLDDAERAIYSFAADRWQREASGQGLDAKEAL